MATRTVANGYEASRHRPRQLQVLCGRVRGAAGLDRVPIGPNGTANGSTPVSCTPGGMAVGLHLARTVARGTFHMHCRPVRLRGGAGGPSPCPHSRTAVARTASGPLRVAGKGRPVTALPCVRTTERPARRSDRAARRCGAFREARMRSWGLNVRRTRYRPAEGVPPPDASTGRHPFNGLQHACVTWNST